MIKLLRICRHTFLQDAVKIFLQLADLGGPKRIFSSISETHVSDAVSSKGEENLLDKGAY